MSYATTDQLQTALHHTITGGDALAEIIGHIIAAGLDSHITTEDVNDARQAILAWHAGIHHIRPLTT